MITKETLQEFVDKNADKIAQILPRGLKDKNGKWLLICPVMESYDLDFSKVNVEKVEVSEEVEEKPKKTRKSKKK